MYKIEIKKSFSEMVEVNLIISKIIPIADIEQQTLDFSKIPSEADFQIKFQCESLIKGLFDSALDIEYEDIFDKLLHKLLDMQKVSLGAKDKRKVTMDYRLE